MTDFGKTVMIFNFGLGKPLSTQWLSVLFCGSLEGKIGTESFLHDGAMEKS